MYSRSPSKFMSKQKILVLSCAKGCILRKRAYSMRKENNLANTIDLVGKGVSGWDGMC